mmetsp:Transcript_47556/g.126980  ORF Transcript_47556/g.126980 Transcript_47556/m.126980 type:complete len:219 (+) Transcript_47556:219-875(+)
MVLVPALRLRPLLLLALSSNLRISQRRSSVWLMVYCGACSSLRTRPGATWACKPLQPLAVALPGKDGRVRAPEQHLFGPAANEIVGSERETNIPGGGRRQRAHIPRNQHSMPRLVHQENVAQHDAFFLPVSCWAAFAKARFLKRRSKRPARRTTCVPSWAPALFFSSKKKCIWHRACAGVTGTFFAAPRKAARSNGPEPTRRPTAMEYCVCPRRHRLH